MKERMNPSGTEDHIKTNLLKKGFIMQPYGRGARPKQLSCTKINFVHKKTTY